MEKISQKNAGVISDFFPSESYGIIRTPEKDQKFHFSNKAANVSDGDIVVFDLEKESEKYPAINVRLLVNEEKLKMEYLKENNIYKSLVLYAEIASPSSKKALLNAEKARYIQEFRSKENSYLEAYCNQFSTEVFWDSFQIVVDSSLYKNARDWTEAWFNYRITAEYKIHYKFDGLDFISHQLNFKKYDNKIEPNFKDPYIEDFLIFNKFLYSYRFEKGGSVPKSKIHVPKRQLKNIRKEMILKFKNEYNAQEHLDSLDHYKVLSETIWVRIRHKVLEAVMNLKYN